MRRTSHKRRRESNEEEQVEEESKGHEEVQGDKDSQEDLEAQDQDEEFILTNETGATDSTLDETRFPTEWSCWLKPLEKLRKAPATRVLNLVQEDELNALPSPPKLAKDLGSLKDAVLLEEDIRRRSRWPQLGNQLSAELKIDWAFVKDHFKVPQQAQLVDELDIETGVLEGVLDLIESAYVEQVEAGRIYFENVARASLTGDAFAVTAQAWSFQMRLEAIDKRRKLQIVLNQQVEKLRRIRDEMQFFAEGNFSFASELKGLEQASGVEGLLQAKLKVAQEQRRFVTCLDAFFRHL